MLSAAASGASSALVSQGQPAPPAPAPQAAPLDTAAPEFPRAIGQRRQSEEDDGGLPMWPLVALAIIAFGSGTGALGWFTGRRQLRSV